MRHSIMSKATIKPIDSDIILVPTDFSEVAGFALRHATHLGKIFKKKIVLLHIIEGGGILSSAASKAQKEEEANQKLGVIAASCQTNSGIDTSFVVRQGSIFDEIGDAAEDLNASLVLMGTHGVKGMQHVIGSKALRVINHANRPFVVVQKKDIRSHGYKNIVLPIDFSKETKQKLVWAAELAKVFASKFHILAAHESDEYAANSVRNNLAYASNYLLERGCDVSVHQAPKGDFSKETIRFANSVDADLIIIMTNPEKDLGGFVIGAEEQGIIANDSLIPVMTLNPVDTSKAVNGHLFNFSNF
jgi:nucleotide-binding universal stress UspA family protein